MIWDVIDNPSAYSVSDLVQQKAFQYDALFVQTSQHREWLISQGINAVVLPHAHGNMGRWSVAAGVRKKLGGVAIVFGDRRNAPNKTELRRLTESTCRVGATLYLVHSSRHGMKIEEQRCASQVDFGGQAIAACKPLELGCSKLTITSDVFNASRVLTMDSLQGVEDPAQQRPCYDTPSLLQKVDVGLLWFNGATIGSPFALANRPPTRMHFWWSHGIPVLSAPLVAYTEAAARIAYPRQLVSLTSTDQYEKALCQIGPAHVRACLRRMVLSGSLISSPSYGALQLVKGLCDIAANMSDGRGSFTSSNIRDMAAERGENRNVGMVDVHQSLSVGRVISL